MRNVVPNFFYKSENKYCSECNRNALKFIMFCRDTYKMASLNRRKMTQKRNRGQDPRFVSNMSFICTSSIVYIAGNGQNFRIQPSINRAVDCGKEETTAEEFEKCRISAKKIRTKLRETALQYELG